MDSNSDPSVVQPVTSRYTDYAIPAPFPLSLIDFISLCIFSVLFFIKVVFLSFVLSSFISFSLQLHVVSLSVFLFRLVFLCLLIHSVLNKCVTASRILYNKYS
jgi:hypothetical protein